MFLMAGNGTQVTRNDLRILLLNQLNNKIAYGKKITWIV